jgi:hypothetical protein
MTNEPRDEHEERIEAAVNDLLSRMSAHEAYDEVSERGSAFLIGGPTEEEYSAWDNLEINQAIMESDQWEQEEAEEEARAEACRKAREAEEFRSLWRGRHAFYFVPTAALLGAATLIMILAGLIAVAGVLDAIGLRNIGLIIVGVLGTLLVLRKLGKI